MSEFPAAEGTAYPWLAERGEMTQGEKMANGTEPASADGEEAPVVADSTPSMNDAGNEPAVPFLQSLVDAMRKIADQTRDDALGKLRAAVAERSAGIRAETEQRAAELHELANGDLAGVADWERGEIQRIRDDAATRSSARNAALDAQLAANTAAGEGAMTAVEARVDAFEAEMTSFFAQLNDIHDPAALGSALKRIPTAPSLTDVATAPAGDTAPPPAAAVAPEPEPAAASAIAPAAVPAAAPDVMSESTPEAPSAVAAVAMPEPAASDNGVPEAESASAAPVAVATAAEPAPAEGEVVAPPVAEAVEEATTQVLVTGLTSFGAITSFKQSLERVDGVSRVSLGLGTSGEFIFTAVHRAGFDLSAAIRSFEEAAQFAASNGQLRVTVGSKA